MNARKYLESIKEISERIKQNQERVQQLHDILTSFSAPMDREQVSHTKNVDIMAETIAKMVDMEREIDQQTAQLFVTRQQAETYIRMLKPIHARILKLRYVDMKSTEDIASETSYAPSYVFALTRSATDEFQRLLNKLGIEAS